MMTITTTFPGVYAIENKSDSYAILKSATAVPLFAFVRSNNLPVGEDIQVLNSWQDCLALREGNHTGYLFYISLRVWFMNGGGRCYLVSKDSIVEAVGKYDDITLLVAAGEDISAEFDTVINAGYRGFGLFDGPKSKISADDPAKVMKKYPESPYAAAFYPWLTLSWSSQPAPPSVFAAIAIAKADSTRGVWKAPANIVINGVTPAFPVTDALQGQFNQGKALNMIRTFPNVGTMLWGARTLEDSDNWRYIPVRRLFNMVERDIQRALKKLVFEPNSQVTWQRIKSAVNNYLFALWKQGALVGNKQEEAWFVNIGKGTTMTGDDINQGKIIIKIGLAAVRPAEFIILQFSQDMA